MTGDANATGAGEAPRRLGPYLLFRELGRGGQGQVFAAEDTRLRRRVALKILGLVYDSRFIERFRREASAASRLDHPSICTVFEAGEVDGTHFIAMKLVEGESLEARIDRWRREGLTPSGSGSREAARIQQILEILEKTSRALHVAHEAGLVHRDVKPGNIMIDETGTPVVLDFGLARDERPEEAGLTRSGEMMGTPDYMPPEQLLGAHVDRRSDVYALGATLYEALTLRRPFDAPTRERLFQEILSGEPSDPTRSNRHVGRDLKTVLETALQKDPDRRYDSAAAFADELACVRSLRPIRARPVSRITRASRWARRNPAVAATLTMLLVVLVAGLSTALVLLGQLRVEKDATDVALQQARATALVRASEQAQDEDPMLALLLAREALRAHPSAASRSRLHDALHGSLERAVLCGHERPVTGAMFLPGTDEVLTWSEDGTLRLWAADREVTRFGGDGGSVTAVVCTSDGSLVAAGFESGSVRILDRTLRPVATCAGHQGVVRALAFSPGGDALLTAGDDATARVWSVAGQQLADLRGHERAIWSARFSPDGSRVVTASLDHTARIWTRDGAPVATCQGHSASVISATFSPGGERVLTASFDGTGRIWSLEGQQLAELRGHTGIVISARYLGSGNAILTLSFDATARLWSPEGKEVATLRGHRGRILSADVSLATGLLLTSSDDGTARTWGFDGTPRDMLRGHAAAVPCARFGPRGQIVTASADHTARLWAAHRDEAGVLWAMTPICCAETGPAGDVIVTGSADGSVRIWGSDATLRAEVQAHRDAIRNVRCAQRVPLFATASADGTARLWTLSGVPVAILARHSSEVLDVAFSPAFDVIATCSADRTARLWSGSGHEIAVLRGHDHAVTGAAFSSDGQRLLTWSMDGSAALWDAGGRALARFQGHAGPVRAAAFSPDGMLVVTASADRTARLWDLDGRARATLRDHEGPVNSICMASSGRLCATVSVDATARIWDLDGNEIAVLRHGGEVYSVSFSPDGTMLVTASADGTARLWDSTGAELASLRGHGGPVVSAAFSPDGRHVRTMGKDGEVALWLVRSEDLLRLAETRITRALSVAERQDHAEFLGR
jgi:WD40 repeat protein/serine/threonine protein kinase